MIRGRNVTLRPVEERDHVLIHAWRTDPRAWRSTDDLVPPSLKDVVEGEERARSDGDKPFVIEVEDRPVGRVALEGFRGRDRRCAITTLAPDPDAWTAGHARDAIAALVGFAFERNDLHQIEARALATDEGAIAAYEACGFVREATLRDRTFKDGAWIDHVVMTVRRDSFAATRA